jgi:penicillin-binding protein 2
MNFVSSWHDTPDQKKRFLTASLIVLAVFLLLLLRLWHLQIIRADRYRGLSEKNRTRYIPVTAPRGRIHDRDGRLLADNRPAFDVTVLRKEVDDPEQLLDHLARYLAVDRQTLRERWQAGKKLPRYRPIPLAWDVDRTTMERIMENALDLPGVLIETRPVRSFPQGALAPHLLGYLGEINEQQLRTAQFAYYRAGEFVGKAGLEKQLEGFLHGETGVRRVEVDVQGKNMRILNTREPLPGHNIFLTLNSDLQRAAQQAFGDQAGAAVALDIHTGEVLAMVSQPAFDPACFARGLTGEEWRDLLHNPLHPLQNRAVSGQYPPGSIFKIVTALAALKAGVATSDTTVYCKGAMTLGDHTFRCWKRAGHGRTDLRKALKESCDVWFYQVALEVGIDRIAAMARDLGLGEALGLPVDLEKSGLIPDRQWKKQRFGSSWYKGETLNAAIGQGYILTTPLQLAAMTAAVANGGQVLRPRIIQRIETCQGQVRQQSRPEVLRRAELSPAHLATVRSALEAVVNERGGTAWGSRLEQLPYAGKTGTAQVVKLREKIRNDRDIPYRFRDHALFAAYAPAQKPQIAVAVVVEHGLHGSSAAAPIAQAMIASYFGLPAEENAGRPVVTE